MLIDSLLHRCDGYLAARSRAGLRPWSEARLSTVLFGGGRKLARLRAGGDVETATFQAAMDRLAGLEAELTAGQESAA